MRTSEFRQYLRGKIEKHGGSRNKGIQLVITVLTTSLIDLECYNLLGKNRHSCLKDFTQWDVDYFKHCKRCCLIELWAVTEIRIREIAEEGRLLVKGRDTVIGELIAKARKINRNREVEKYLRKVKKKLGSKFIEFPNYLSEILRMSDFNKEETRDWRCFFDIFRIMRNSVHNNFTCTETRQRPCCGFTKDFVEGQPLKVQFNDLGKIIEKLLEFFDAIES